MMTRDDVRATLLAMQRKNYTGAGIVVAAGIISIDFSYWDIDVLADTAVLVAKSCVAGDSDGHVWIPVEAILAIKSPGVTLQSQHLG